MGSRNSRCLERRKMKSKNSTRLPPAQRARMMLSTLKYLNISPSNIAASAETPASESVCTAAYIQLNGNLISWGYGTAVTRFYACSQKNENFPFILASKKNKNIIEAIRLLLHIACTHIFTLRMLRTHYNWIYSSLNIFSHSSSDK